MNNLLNITNTELTISTREIAELCNKQHNKVCNIIEDLIHKGIAKSATPQNYINSQNKQTYKEYLLNKRDSLVLVARLSPEFTAKVIDRWQELESKITLKAPSSLKEALFLAYQQQEQLEEQQRIIQEAKPKVLFASAVEGCTNTISVGELAKILKQNGIDIGQNRLFVWLRCNEYIHKHKTTPTQKSMELGLFTIKETAITNASGETKIYITPKVTGKGQTYFVNKFLNNTQLFKNKRAVNRIR